MFCATALKRAVIPSAVEESRSIRLSSSTGSFDFAALHSDDDASELHFCYWIWSLKSLEAARKWNHAATAVHHVRRFRRKRKVHTSQQTGCAPSAMRRPAYPHAGTRGHS